MTTITRRGAMGLAAGAAALPILGAPARAATPITVGALRFTSHAASFVALERGYFDDEGLSVELSFFQAAQPMAVAVASGDVGYAVTAITGGLVSLADKGAARVVAGAVREEPGVPGQVILASNEAHAAGLTSPAALDGRRWGVTQPGSSFHYMGSRIAEAEGAALSYVPLQKVPAVIGALRSGQIDAWSIVPHIGRALAASGAAQAIGEVSDYMPDYQVTTVFTSADAASGERERTQAFLRAFERGAQDFNAALVDGTAGEEAAEAMVALLAPYVYPDRPAEEAATPIREGAMRIATALNADSVRDQLDWFASEGLVEGASYETLVDPSYAAGA